MVNNHKGFFVVAAHISFPLFHLKKRYGDSPPQILNDAMSLACARQHGCATASG